MHGYFNFTEMPHIFGTTDVCNKHYRRLLICMHYGCALLVNTTDVHCCLSIADVLHVVSTTDVQFKCDFGMTECKVVK